MLVLPVRGIFKVLCDNVGKLITDQHLCTRQLHAQALN